MERQTVSAINEAMHFSKILLGEPPPNPEYASEILHLRSFIEDRMIKRALDGDDDPIRIDADDELWQAFCRYLSHAVQYNAIGNGEDAAKSIAAGIPVRGFIYPQWDSLITELDFQMICVMALQAFECNGLPQLTAKPPLSLNAFEHNKKLQFRDTLDFSIGSLPDGSRAAFLDDGRYRSAAVHACFIENPQILETDFRDEEFDGFLYNRWMSDCVLNVPLRDVKTAKGVIVAVTRMGNILGRLPASLTMTEHFYWVFHGVANVGWPEELLAPVIEKLEKIASMHEAAVRNFISGLSQSQRELLSGTLSAILL